MVAGGAMALLPPSEEDSDLYPLSAEALVCWLAPLLVGVGIAGGGLCGCKAPRGR